MPNIVSAAGLGIAMMRRKKWRMQAVMNF